MSEQRTTETNSGQSENEESNGLRDKSEGCGRRGFLRGLGAAAAPFAGLTGVATRASADDDSLSREIVVSNEDDEETSYRLTVDGALEAMDDPLGDEVAENTVNGIVHGWKDGYRFSGAITRFEHDGPVTVHLDGEQVDPDSLGSGSADGASADDDSTDGDDADDVGDDFETVAVPADETYTRRIEDGDVLENVRFDVSAEGSHVNLDCRGDGWVLRNVGVSGESTYPEKDQVIHVDCDGEGLIENVYLGDGCDARHHGTGIFVSRESEGRLTIRDVNVEDWVDNGIYASAPGHARRPNGGCEVTIENCYGRNNNTANFRIGSDGSTITESVSVANGPVEAKVSSDGDVKRNCRPVWVTEGGDCVVENCDLVATHDHADHCVVEGEREVGGTVRVTDCRLTTREKRWRTKHGEIVPRDVSYPDEGEATTAVPDGVPETAEEAASGGENG